MQSVSQYDTSDPNPANPTHINQNFRTFAPANRPAVISIAITYALARRRIRPPRYEKTDCFHCTTFTWPQSCGWIQLRAGWQLSMAAATTAWWNVFNLKNRRGYPGKASIIFWTNGPELKLSHDGTVSLSSGGDGSPTYLEAELNSPLCRLRAGEACNFETEWFPTRVGSEFHGVADGGIVARPLKATRLENGKIAMSGSFGVFFAGRLVAHLYDDHGSSLGNLPVADVDPADLVSMETEIAPTGKPARISLHLEDSNGLDRGSFQEIPVSSPDNR